jgi:hypothetical protein
MLVERIDTGATSAQWYDEMLDYWRLSNRQPLV